MITETMPEQVYHSRPELSSTGARRLLESPAKFNYWRTHQEPPRAAFDLGTAVHTKVLGTGATTIVYPDEHLTPSGNVSTKAATVAWELEQRANGLIPISAADERRVNGMTEAVLANEHAKQILEAIAGREVTIISDVDGVECRARFDLYDFVRAADLKTARDASPGGFNRAVGQHGYHIQERFYEDTHRAETGTGLESFHFIVVENTAPYLVGVYELDFMWDDIAAKKTKQARDLYRECTDTGVWPGYGTASLTPPTWAVFESEEEEIRV
ncbi:PD-(D/E)XK nuclease-like domain-containing protein [Pseudactinotalea sp.]|uniref:PD-(D/E)XK nuclease-like domain-containing protein n=1 Tax=Pseudactinotalea sp. TaxID=1926260 RepID=UPI003B3AD081